MKLRFIIFSLLLGGSSLFAQKSIDQNGIKISTAPLHCNVPSEGYEADLIAPRDSIRSTSISLRRDSHNTKRRKCTRCRFMGLF